MLSIAKAFLYSRDGVNALHAAPGGDACDVPEPLRAGLLAAGYLRDMATPLTPAVSVPLAPGHTDLMISPEAIDEALAALGEPPPVFDPATAGIATVRAFLAEQGLKPHHKTGDAKLRELAAQALVGEPSAD